MCLPKNLIDFLVEKLDIIVYSSHIYVQSDDRRELESKKDTPIDLRSSEFSLPDFHPAHKIRRSNPACLPRKRDREVPCGVKGGELNMPSKKKGGAKKSTAKKAK